MNTVFYRPSALAELLKLRAHYPQAAVLAGGTDLLVYMREGKVSAPVLLDITGVKELRGIREEGEAIIVGACTTFTDTELSEVFNRRLPCLCQAAASVGSPQIRNRGTLGGSIVNANPSSDIIPVLTVAQASVKLLSEKGSRLMSIEDFITGNGKTALEPDEILYQISIPKPKSGARMLFEKVGRRNALAIARLNGACMLWRAEGESGVIEDIRISIGAATNRPIRMSEAERLLIGRCAERTLLEEAGRIVSDTILENTGYRHSSGYKLPVAAEMSARMIQRTWQSEAVV